MLSSVIMPLFVALLLSMLLEAPVAKLAAVYGSRRLAATVVFGLTVAVALLGLGFGVSGLFAEAENLLNYLLSTEVPCEINGLPFNPESALADWGVELLRAATDVLRATPELLLSFFVTLFAAYYLLVEPDLPLRALAVLAPNHLAEQLAVGYGRVLAVFSAYIRAQAVVVLLTFVVSLLGLSLLGVEYVLLFAFLLALLDLLPMIGPGTLLLPWSILEILQGDGGLALGLLLLLVAIIVGRQVVEPKIMGSGLGLHPLAALLGGFFGLTLLGTLGLLIGPMLVSLVYVAVKQRAEDRV